MKKRIVLCLLVSGLGIISHDLRCAGLDDATEKKVTVRSEIQRGIGAVKDANAKASLEKLAKRILRMEEVTAQNRQQNTDTDGFVLGAAVARFYLADLAQRVSFPNGAPKRTDPKDAEDALKQIDQLSDYSSASLECRSALIEVKAMSARLGLSDEQLSDLLGVGREFFLPRVAAWMAQIPTADFQKKAVDLHPEIGVAGSALNRDFVARYNRYKTEHPEVLADPAWPLRLAEECSSPNTMVSTR